MKLSARRKTDAVFPGLESSQRSRTLLFVGAACVVAAVGGSNQVWLNENGIMALHLPLTAARIGSLSTHTASPPIVERMRALASDVLGGQLRVDNHLVAMTKPEVVERAVALGAGAQLQDTVSCWSIGRTRTHCGICAPCLIRRISCRDPRGHRRRLRRRRLQRPCRDRRLPRPRQPRPPHRLHRRARRPQRR